MRVARLSLWFGLTALVLGALPDAALACSVCFSATEENRLAFIITTVVLSVLPLALLGGGVFWLWRRALAQERARELDSFAPELERLSR